MALVVLEDQQESDDHLSLARNLVFGLAVLDEGELLELLVKVRLDASDVALDLPIQTNHELCLLVVG